jgi:hypothetical protein
MLVTPRQPVAPPPPCWCGRSWQAHEDASAVHQYVPADGLESEAYEAW